MKVRKVKTKKKYASDHGCFSRCQNQVFFFLVLEKLISGASPGMIEIQFINVGLGNVLSRIILKHKKGILSLYKI